MIKNIPALLNKIEDEIRVNTDMAVIGLSGGADSTLVAILCIRALGKKTNICGIHMPYSDTDVNGFNSRSKILAKHLGIQNQTVNIRPAVDALSSQFGSKLSTINQGNMRSRMRMITLYTVACFANETQASIKSGRRVRVVGTGNLSEDYIGYDTKGGDALVDFSPIGSLFKSEVYQLLDYFIQQGVINEEHVDRVPSAGLWEGQTDEGEIGHTYAEMEPAILRCIDGTKDLNNELDKFVWVRHFANLHKRVGPPVIELRMFC